MKLADFGVAAKLSEGEDGDDSLAAAVVGTPYWMAPEVLLIPLRLPLQGSPTGKISCHMPLEQGWPSNALGHAAAGDGLLV